MKTLINKANHAIRITAPEIDITTSVSQTEYIIRENSGEILMICPEKYWTLVEEEQQLPANLDKAAEEYMIENLQSSDFRVFEQNVESFKVGARWMAEQIKGGSK